MTRATISAMRAFWPTPSKVALERIHDLDAGEIAQALERLGFERRKMQEIADHWPAMQKSSNWTGLLAAGCTMVSADRGNVDAPLPMWADLNDEGDVGRLFYFYLFALCYNDTVAFLRQRGTPEPIINASLGILTRHAATHERKWGNLGVETGWWMLLVLRGELLQIDELQFHRVNLGVGTSSPEWYDEDDAQERGVGFRRGDPSVGVHIPQDADLSPDSLDRTFDAARQLLGQLWPVSQRRLATCRSWTMDERLVEMLAPGSNLVLFQQRFELVRGSVSGDADVLEFVFRLPNTAIDALPQRTTLERAVVALLRQGGQWRNRTGWFDFDS